MLWLGTISYLPEKFFVETAFLYKIYTADTIFAYVSKYKSTGLKQDLSLTFDQKTYKSFVFFLIWGNFMREIVYYADNHSGYFFISMSVL